MDPRTQREMWALIDQFKQKRAKILQQTDADNWLVMYRSFAKFVNNYHCTPQPVGNHHMLGQWMIAQDRAYDAALAAGTLFMNNEIIHGKWSRFRAYNIALAARQAARREWRAKLKELDQFVGYWGRMPSATDNTDPQDLVAWWEANKDIECPPDVLDNVDEIAAENGDQDDFEIVAKL